MVVAISKRGRPYSIAIIDYVNDSELEFREGFYRICANLNYKEMVALQRALSVSDITLRRWKYKLSFPSHYIAQQVIDWDKQDRPMREVPPWQSVVDMF